MRSGCVKLERGRFDVLHFIGRSFKQHTFEWQGRVKETDHVNREIYSTSTHVTVNLQFTFVCRIKWRQLGTQTFQVAGPIWGGVRVESSQPDVRFPYTGATWWAQWCFGLNANIRMITCSQWRCCVTLLDSPLISNCCFVQTLLGFLLFCMFKVAHLVCQEFAKRDPNTRHADRRGWLSFSCFSSYFHYWFKAIK